MIDALLLKNFKCHTDLTLDLANLTLLSGHNAGGKTSSVQGALLLAQALEVDGRSSIVPLNGKLVRLGALGDVLTDGGLLGSTITVGVTADSTSLEWEMGPFSESLNASAKIFSITSHGPANRRTLQIGPKMKFESLLTSTIRSKTTEKIVNRLREISVITSTRQVDQEIFETPLSGRPIKGNVGIRGEFGAWWLARLSEDDVPKARCCPSDHSTALRRQVNAWGDTLFPGFEADATDLGRSNLVRLAFRTSTTSEFRNPSNVGYGLTYAFPIIVACLSASRGQTIFIDTPEAHLHPQAQSNMGKFLSIVAASGVQLIVETHSDHVLNGIRVAVKEGRIAPSKVSVNFFSQYLNRPSDTVSSTASGLPVKFVATIDSRGRLSSWPYGFFDQIEVDLAKL